VMFMLILAPAWTSSPCPSTQFTDGRSATTEAAAYSTDASRTSTSAAGSDTRFDAAFFVSSHPSTARDMVDLLPGFVFDDGSDARGFAASGGNVLIDGKRPSSKSDDLDNILKRIPASSVDYVELIRRSSRTIDLAGKTIVANVVRKRDAPSLRVLSISATAPTIDNRKLPAIQLEDTEHRGEQTLTTSLKAAQFYQNTGGRGPEAVEDSAGHTLARYSDAVLIGGTQIVADATYSRPAYGGTLGVNTEVFWQRYFLREQDTPLTAAGVLSSDKLTQDLIKAELGLNYDRSWNSKLSSRLVFIQDLARESVADGLEQGGIKTTFDEHHTSGETILRGDTTYTASPRLTLQAGIEADYNWLASATGVSQDGTSIAIPASSVMVEEIRSELFAQANASLTRALTAEVSVKVETSRLSSTGDSNVKNSFTFLKPELVISYKPKAGTEIRLRYERVVGQLNFNDFVASSSLSTGKIIGGNPNLRPQQSNIYEASVENSFTSGLDASLTYTRSDLSDVIDNAALSTSSGIFDIPANIGSGREDQLSAVLTLRTQSIGVPGGMLKANITWRRSQVTDPITRAKRPIGSISPLEGSLEYNQDVPRWHLHWGASLTIPQAYETRSYFYNQIEIDRVSPYITLFSEYTIGRRATLRAEIDDIGAKTKRRIYLFPGLRGDVDQLGTDIRILDFKPTIYVRFRQEL